MMDTANQKIIRDGACFCGLALILFFMLFAISHFSKSFWQNGLRLQVEKIIEKVYPDYIVGAYIRPDSPFAISAAVYELQKKGSSDKISEYAIIMRITGMYGPQACVFIYNIDTKYGSFCGLADQSILDKQFTDYGITNMTKSYWIDRIPEIIGNIGV